MFPFLFPVWTVPLTLVLSCQHVCKDIVEKSPDTWLDMDDCCRSSCDKLSESSHFVVFTNSDHAGCLKTRKSKSSSKLFYGSHLLLSASTTKGVIALSSGTSELCALVEATSTGLGAVSMRKDWELTSAKKKTKIDKGVLEERIDASAGSRRSSTTRSWANCGILLLAEYCGCKSSQETAWSKSRKSLEYRNREILEPNASTEDNFEGHWGDVTATFVKEGLESRCQQKCKKSQIFILKFTLVDNACEVDTQSETEVESEQY